MLFTLLYQYQTPEHYPNISPIYLPYTNMKSNKRKQLSRIKARTKKRVLSDNCNKDKKLIKHRANIKAKAEQYKRFIYNYTKYQLTNIEIIALARGFKFIPTPSKPPRTQLLCDFHQLARKKKENDISWETKK